MSIAVMSWVWRESQAKGPALLILLAIADHASDDGGNAYPSIGTLAAKARVSERTAQRCVNQLVEMGELDVRRCAGQNRTNVYRLPMKTPTVSHPVIPSPRQPDTPSLVSPPRVPKPAERVSAVAPKGDKGDTQTVLEPSIEPSVEPSDARARKVNTSDVIALAAFFTESVPISNTSRVRSVIAKALGAGHTPAAVRAALDTLIAEDWGCSEETLRIALQPRARGRPNPAQARNAANADVVRRLAARQNQPAIGGPP